MKINKKQLKEFIREYVKETLSENPITERKYRRLKLKDLIPEEIVDWQGRKDEDFKFKKDMMVKDTNPDCPHRNSEGKVTKVSGDKITYETTNNGRNWKIGDKLTKTKDNLILLGKVNKDE